MPLRGSGDGEKEADDDAKLGGDSSGIETLRVLVVHGPNLNLLGEREPEVYGRTRLADIDRELKQLGDELGMKVETFQSNSEGDDRHADSGGARQDRCAADQSRRDIRIPAWRFAMRSWRWRRR